MNFSRKKRNRWPQLAAVAVIGVPVSACTDSQFALTRDEKGLIPRRYECHRTDQPPTIDGRLDDSAWRGASWTEAFVDIEGTPRPMPLFRTRAKILWDNACLYIGAELEEPHVWATLRKHDEIVFHDNDFEVFIDPDADSKRYAEIEINALGTIFDLLLERTYRDGGPANHGWNVAGLRSAVFIDGTLNDPRDEDRAWSVEFAIPWATFGDLTRQALPPRPGETWRMNFSRVEWRIQIIDGSYRKVAGLREDNWVWSPQGVIDMHRPERWGYVSFRADP